MLTKLRVARAIISRNRVTRLARATKSSVQITSNEFQDFLKDLSSDFNMNDACGCSLTTEPVTGELIGRQTELTKMLDLLAITLPQDARYPVIQMAAPSGSGKSATLQELARIFLSEDRRGYGKMFSKKKKVRER